MRFVFFQNRPPLQTQRRLKYMYIILSLSLSIYIYIYMYIYIYIYTRIHITFVLLRLLCVLASMLACMSACIRACGHSVGLSLPEVVPLSSSVWYYNLFIDYRIQRPSRVVTNSVSICLSPQVCPRLCREGRTTHLGLLRKRRFQQNSSSLNTPRPEDGSKLRSSSSETLCVVQ